MLNWAEHAEDNCHAYDVVDSMEHSRKNHQSIVQVVQRDDGVEHLKESISLDTEKEEGGEGDYEKTKSWEKSKVGDIQFSPADSLHPRVPECIANVGEEGQVNASKGGNLKELAEQTAEKIC